MTAPIILSLDGKSPRIHDTAFVAPGAVVIGDVEIGPEASIWYNCVVRADTHHIRIGARTNIQDGSIVHCDGPTPEHPDGFPTEIGEDVLIGHMAMVHGCTLMPRAFVGLGCIVMNGCVIEGDAMLAAGAMLTPGKRVPAGQLWQGRPAKHARDLSAEDIAEFAKGVPGYVENARRHRGAVAVRDPRWDRP